MMNTDTKDLADLTFWQTLLENLGAFGLKLLWAAVAVAVCVLIAWVLRFVIRRVVKRIVEGAKSKAKVDDTRALERSPLAAVRVVQRTRTLGSILTNVVNITMVIVALVLVASILAPNVLASLSLLTAALGAGLGFGAQNIVKDVLNGIFIVAEDQVGIGDVVDLGLATGVVEFVSIRITHVRDVNGVLWYVRNGEITRIGNMTQGWSRVVLDLTLPKDIVIEDVEHLLTDTALALAHDPRWRSRVIGEPEVWGLESLEGDTLVIRLVIKAKPTAKDDVARELRERLRAVLLNEGIDVTGIARAVLEGAEGALRVRGANPPTLTSELPERPTWRPRSGAAQRQSEEESGS
ncbi:mechanosensitive ion channel family protein [Microbacterium oryzae]|uniref:Mechanosensitive ion channel family protein n=1 Tax=Microbacterium oryzae TaxID=743009 RepID=A0A6I6DXD0_9MICO|nr:mechanosensitive ion channel domain-containing protein [Microbacterium oryzae]QGU26654.1 mechanosensitive ion channel family protein [Microbacterium oryzae]